MHSRTAGLAAAAVIALATIPVTAQERGPGFGPGGPGGPGGLGGPPPILRMAKQLGLTDAQQDQIEAIETRYRDGDMGDTMDAMLEARENLGRTIHDEKASVAAVTKAAGAVAALEAPLALARHRMVVEISRVLTAEQKEMLEGLARAHRDRAAPSRRGL